MMRRNCDSCGEEIPIKRLEILPNTKTCVNCSQTGKKGGITLQLGEGDHTYNEIVILEPEDVTKYNEAKKELESIELEIGEVEDKVFPSMNEITRSLEKEEEDVSFLDQELEEKEEPKEEDEDAIS